MNKVESGYWYCPYCKIELGPQRVTYEEKCDTCGHCVEWIDNNKTIITLPDDSLKFLQDLCNKLNTQDQRSTATPVGYVIRQKIREICPEGYQDGCMIWDNEGTTIYDTDSKEDWKVFFPEDSFNIDWNIVNTLVDLYEQVPSSEYNFGYYTWEEKLDTNLFLTEEAIKKHLELNYYHYKNADTYAIYLWRNPEMEQLLKILFQITGIEDRRE